MCSLIVKVKLATLVEGDLKAPFPIATTPGLLHFTLDPYLIMLSDKQGGIKYHFLSHWYDTTWRLNPGFPGHCRTLEPSFQCPVQNIPFFESLV